MSAATLATLVPGRDGIPSVCSAHPLVIEAALRHGKARGGSVLIEATCNQVNQEGGYTGMTPIDFRRFVEGIAGQVGFDSGHLILGGDHLGPNPWKDLPAAEAMTRAEVMIAAYAAAGFTKLHLDCSMGCQGEGEALPDPVTAERAARLAQIAEAQAVGEKPRYVIGTEVPVPGGVTGGFDHLAVTQPEAVAQTVEVHRQAFVAGGLDAAFERVIAVVVQPGVEFGNESIVVFRPEAAQALSAALSGLPGLVFEAHSTDYQPRSALTGLVRGGFAVLKVGPGLTFAVREMLYALDAVARLLVPGDGGLMEDMDALMRDEPGHWARYYPGDETARKLQRHFSYSDRIRYYWPHPRAQAAVGRLMARLGERAIPETLISQYLPTLYPAVAAGTLVPKARALVMAGITRVLEDYAVACTAA